MNFNIFYIFKNYGSPLHFDFILEKTGNPRSTLYRQLKILMDAGLVDHYGKGLYTPGWLVDDLSRVKKDEEEKLIENSIPIMHEINEETGESVNLTIVKGSKVKVLTHLESNYNLKYSYQEGENLNIFKGASSKILLAYLSDAHQENLISTEFSGEEKLLLQKELDSIRQKGYSITKSEVDENAIGISAPILRGGKYLLAGISIAGPVFRIDENKISYYTKLLKEAAFDISLILDE